MVDTSSDIWLTRPASKWLSAMPVGNGRLGAMTFGRVNKEMIGLNEETVWTKQNPDRLNPDAAQYIPKIREALLDGRPLDAHFIGEYAAFGRPHYQATYQQLATLKLLLKDHHFEHASEYRRSLDLANGVAAVTYRLGDVVYLREIFASAVDDVMFVRLTSSHDEPVELALNLYRKQDAVGTCLDDETLELTGSRRQQRNDVCVVRPGCRRERVGRGRRRSSPRPIR